MRPDPTPDLDRWRRIEEILDQALELSPQERSALLDAECAGDPELRAEVEALLAADADAGDFLGVPAGEYVPDLLAEAAGEEEGEADLTGHQIGRYRILREVGSGGMGTVYEAEDTQLRRRVALKLLPPEVGRDPQAKERFRREAQAAAAVDHPNLCTVHEIDESGGRLYIVLTFYEGETLRERLRRGPLPVADAREVAIQVARGLARAHEAGITHRDIKPANVFVTSRGEVKILDFGIARLEGDEVSLTGTGATLGTPAYMSPEQARGGPVDNRTDIWSLGVLLYEMVAGRRPFEGRSLEAVVSAILTRQPEPLDRVRPDVPPELARVVDQALAKAPAARYDSAAKLLGDLEAGRAPRRRSWKRKALRIGVLAGALAVLGGGFALWRLLRPPLRVAVLRPQVESVGNDPERAFVGSEVLEATLAALVTLEGLQALPPEPSEETGSAAEKLRADDADEALRPVLGCEADSCSVVVRRQKPGGKLLDPIGPFEIQTGVENAYSLAEAVKFHVQQAYSDHRPGSTATVRSEDYSAYTGIKRRIDEGAPLGGDLDRLDDLLRTSPGLLGAQLLAAEIARGERRFDRALTYAQKAQELAPRDPRPLVTRLRIEVEGQKPDDARETLKQLKELAPGDARVQSAEADLLEDQGELARARDLRRKVAERRPTWRHIVELATLEARLGESGSARRRLEDLLKTQPENRYVKENLAFLEASSGDLRRAAMLYEELIQARPARGYLTNLGFVRYLLGDPAAAAEAYRRALAMDPDDPLLRFNLATSLEALGRRDEARSLYRGLTSRLAALPVPAVSTSLLQAQCLARLGEKTAAESLAAEVLRKQIPEDVQDLNRAAQLYALLGDRVSALFYARQALQKGLRREWFTIPELKALREDPDFRALLGE